MRAIGTALLGAAMVLAAAAFGSPSLFVPGIALILLAFVASAWVVLAGLDASLERRTTLATVEEEHPWPMEIVARTGVLPAPGGVLREPLLRGTLPMAGRTGRDIRVNVTFERRGRRRLEPTTLLIGDPLGLVERRLEAGAGQEVLVLPRVEPVVAAGRGAVSRADTAGGTRPAESAAEIEMESLRPYREGTPASRIHWPTVARTGTLMERRLLADSDSRPLVVLDAGGSPDEHALDAAVRAGASLSVHLARLGGCSLLLPGDRRPTDLEPDLAAWSPLHIRLALVGPEDGSPTARMHARRGAIFWVTARPLTQRPRALDRIQAECYLVTPGPAEARAAFTVAGCTGVPLGRARRSAA
jgi:uncharacterized protein (DUF58 family)